MIFYRIIPCHNIENYSSTKYHTSSFYLIRPSVIYIGILSLRTFPFFSIPFTIGLVCIYLNLLNQMSSHTSNSSVPTLLGHNVFSLPEFYYVPTFCIVATQSLTSSFSLLHQSLYFFQDLNWSYYTCVSMNAFMNTKLLSFHGGIKKQNFFSLV